MIDPTIFLQAMASISAGVVITDVAGEIVYVNAALQRRSGCDVGNTLETLCESLQEGSPDSEKTNEITEAVSAGRNCLAELRSIDQSGAAAWSEVTLTPITNADGAVGNFICSVRDITDRKAFEAQLISLERHYRFILDNALAAIVVHRANTEIVYANKLAEDLLGVRQEDMLGVVRTDPRWRFLREDGAALPLDDYPVNQAVSSKAVVTNILIGSLKVTDGALVWLLCNAYPVIDERGIVSEVVVTFYDVTDLKSVQTELERAKQAAEAASIAKATFLSNMSHEIRTPLTAIVGFSGLLADDPTLSQRARHNVQRITDGAEILMALVNNILDFSKLEAGKFTLDPHPFDPVELVEATALLLAPHAAAKGLTIKVTTLPGIPERVEADSARLRQILLNLVTNGIKFTSSGHVGVHVGYDVLEQSLRVSVSDTGCGIAPDKTAQLFQRFSQVDAAINRKYGGSGLGLAICKELVELMGGGITLASQVGSGTTFTFTIAAKAAPKAAVVGETFVDPALSAHDRSLSLLIIDDVAQNRELVRTMLEAVGHSINEAVDGVQGVRAALAKRYDLILMDVQMPGMDGLEATRAIRSAPGPNQKTPILALSANVLDQHLADCHAAGMEDHIAKPISPREMLSKIAVWTERHLTRS